MGSVGQAVASSSLFSQILNKLGINKNNNSQKITMVKEKEAPASEEELLPVSLLCGFLGAGKTTLLKHVLETKHAEENFKCAVIVNDMAALNIDKALIDQSALVQSDEVIAMQNGCFCCTLQSDLVDQIVELAGKKMFNYILIEASGVSEPSQIAPLFEPCDDEHDHEEEHQEGPQLAEVARLDTCVTVVDAAEFYTNLESMKVYELLRSKGFIWIATSNYIMGGFQQAGNILRIEAQGPWMCENPEQWEGTPNEALIYKDMVDEKGVEYPYMDRRQELVFIGHKLNHLAIQKALDDCLLTEEEMKLGPQGWEETMTDLDKIQMSLDYDPEDLEGEEEEEVEDEETEEPPNKKSKREKNGNEVSLEENGAKKKTTTSR